MTNALSSSSLCEILSRIPVFKSFTQSQLLKVLQVSRFKRFAINEYICRKGEISTVMHILLSGDVAVYRDGQIMTTRSAFSAIGLKGFLTKTTQSETIQVIKPVTALVVERSQLDILSSKDHDIGVTLLGNISQTLSSSLSERDENLYFFRQRISELESTIQQMQEYITSYKKSKDLKDDDVIRGESGNNESQNIDPLRKEIGRVNDRMEILTELIESNDSIIDEIQYINHATDQKEGYELKKHKKRLREERRILSEVLRKLEAIHEKAEGPRESNLVFVDGSSSFASDRDVYFVITSGFQILKGAQIHLLQLQDMGYRQAGVLRNAKGFLVFITSSIRYEVAVNACRLIRRKDFPAAYIHVQKPFVSRSTVTYTDEDSIFNEEPIN
ncbi:MAG: cyclic nucleotide-binding domain-containing protein [Spirochaetia bacterium]